MPTGTRASRLGLCMGRRRAGCANRILKSRRLALLGFRRDLPAAGGILALWGGGLLRRVVIIASIVTTVAAVIGVSWPSGQGKSIYQQFADRPYDVVHIGDRGILLSQISQQELQAAAAGDIGVDSMERMAQLEREPYGRMPEYLPTDVRAVDGGPIDYWVVSIPYDFMDEVRYVQARVIRVDGRTILRQEPGAAGPGFHANATAYYTFYEAPYLFGLDPEEMKITLLTPDRIDEHDMHEVAAALGQYTHRTWSWAHHGHASPDGSRVAYTRDRRAALTAC